MAVVSKTIKSGGDYTSIAAWESAHVSFGTDIWKGVCSASVEYNETPNLQGGSGTPSITSYLWLTSDPANRHAGIAGTGHARIRGSSGAHVITITADWTRVDWLELHQDSGSSSSEGIRLNTNVDDFLISYCIIWTDTTGSNDQDGIYSASSSVSGAIDNCVVYGWQRAAIHQQNDSTYNIEVDHCSLHSQGNDGSSGADQGGAIRVADGTGTTIQVYNTWGINEDLGTAGNGRSFWNTGTNDAWSGSHNAHHGARSMTNDTTTNWQDCSSGWADVSKTTGSWIVITETALGTFDATPLDDEAGNLIVGNGTDRQGSEPDARQDFSVDITGSARPTTGVDIGAIQTASSGTSYDDLNLLVSVASTITETNQLDMVEDTSLAVASTVDGADARVMAEPVELAVVSTVDGADNMVMVETTDVVVASTVDMSEQLTMAEATDITVVSTVDGSEGLEWTDQVEMVIGSTITIEEDGLSMVETVEFGVLSTVDNPLNTLASVENVSFTFISLLDLPTEDFIPEGFEPVITGPPVIRGAEHRIMKSDTDADSHPERTSNRPRIRRS